MRSKEAEAQPTLDSQGNDVQEASQARSQKAGSTSQARGCCMLIARQQVNKWLRLSYRASHRLIDGGKFVHAGQVTALLNSVRKGSQPAVIGEWVPSMLLTTNELASELSSDAMTITSRDVLNWTRRQFPVPHFSLSNRNLLFDKSQVEMWMQAPIHRRKRKPVKASDTATAPASVASQPQPSQPTE